MRTDIVIVIALLIGPAGGGAIVAQRNAAELDKRAHYTRALFRVAERHVGHEKLVFEWRAEAAKK